MFFFSYTSYIALNKRIVSKNSRSDRQAFFSFFSFFLLRPSNLVVLVCYTVTQVEQEKKERERRKMRPLSRSTQYFFADCQMPNVGHYRLACFDTCPFNETGCCCRVSRGQKRFQILKICEGCQNECTFQSFIFPKSFQYFVFLPCFAR